MKIITAPFNAYICTMDTKKRILVVDDEETLRDALCFNLEEEGYHVDACSCAEDALASDLSGYNLFLLDIMMGEISGLQLARILKSNPMTASTPIIFCTAKDSEDDLVAGLDLGADDYITKPYSLRTLIARVRAALRRTTHDAIEADDDIVSYRGLVLRRLQKSCTADGAEVKLTKKEFEILNMLLTSPGHVFSRADLLRELWDDDVVVLERVVDVNITRIRQKLGSYGKHIVTRSGYGYTFSE